MSMCSVFFPAASQQAECREKKGKRRTKRILGLLEDKGKGKGRRESVRQCECVHSSPLNASHCRTNSLDVCAAAGAKRRSLTAATRYNIIV
jgi:hypothetical protein